MASGEIKIIDLGLSSGTFRYQSLKQLHEKTLDADSDLFALGNILYELIHGKKLFPASHEVELYIQMREFRAGPENFSALLPDQVRKILGRSLNQQAVDKYQKVSEFLEDLKGLSQAANFSPWLQEFVHESR
jgi:serine/threonine protein kinase